MPLQKVHLKVDTDDVWSSVEIYDGDNFILEVGDRYAHLPEELKQAHQKDIRIGQLIVDLLKNHAYNDDTTGLYD